MQPRKHPRNIPLKPHYLKIELADFGATTWRIPSMAKAARILKLLQTSGFLDAAKNAADGDGRLVGGPPKYENIAMPRLAFLSLRA